MLAAAVLASASIFHGTPVPTGQAPWLVTLTRAGTVCGGSLVAPDRVITAAHCVQGVDPGELSVRLNGRRRPWSGAIFPLAYHEIPSPVAPDDPQASATLDDVAVIRLRSAVREVAPLPVADPAPVEGEASLTVGHGLTGPAPAGTSARPLGAAQQVSGACPAAYGPALLHPDRHLCTQDTTATHAQACAGDSGSPVMVRRNGAWAVAGVVTWGGETQGRDCGDALPDVSERVDPHRALLTATTAVSPWAERRVRVRRTGALRRCVIGAWSPASATFSVRWWRRSDAGRRTYVSGAGHTRRVRHGAIGCSVTARTAGGWATQDSYNRL
jgi:hypothetical protein